MQRRTFKKAATAVVLACVATVTPVIASVLYVDGAAAGANDGSSWTNAYVTVQAALAVAADRDKPLEIRVAQGVYTPADKDSPFELLNGVTLKGGYAGATAAEPNLCNPTQYRTVLSGDRNGDDEPGAWGPRDNSEYVVTAVETDTSAVLDGFTIANGGMGGVAIENGSVTLCGCTFVNHLTYGLKARGSHGLTLTDCRFIGNDWGAIAGWDCEAALTRCTFQANGAQTGFVAAVYFPNDDDSSAAFRPSHLVLTDCSFCQNGGGGLDVGRAVDLTRCTFTGNRGSAAVHCSGILTARGCSFVANEGGAIVCRDDVLPPARVAPECTVTDCDFIGNTSDGVRDGGALSTDGNTLTVTRCIFAGNEGDFRGAGAIKTSAKVVRLSHCAFTGNKLQRGHGGHPRHATGAVSSDAVLSLVSNCTFCDNRGQVNAFDHERTWNTNSRAVFTQCIVREGDTPFAGNVSVTYSNVEGGYEGEGNVDVDPCFIAPGYWDANDTPGDEDDDFWVTGDYHLKSQAGHWDSDNEDWVFDEVTSLCIDLGDPNGPLGDEPFPNGGFVNLGAYGGTAEASRSYFGGPVCETQIAGDINGDGQIDDLDRDILMSHWLMPDIGKANTPPSITIVSPEDGAELTEPTPIVLRADASDTDGTVLEVQYYLTHDRDITYLGAGWPVADPADGWAHEYAWSRLRCDGVYELWAEAIDNDGARTVSPTITITLHPGQ